MEWSKIKNILIVALILTNCIFIYMIISENNCTDKISESELLEQTTNVLKLNNISIKETVKIPESPDRLSVLTLTYDKKNGVYENKIPENINISDSDTAKQYSNKQIYKMKIDDKISKYLKVESQENINKQNSYTTVCYSYYNGYKIEDSYLKTILYYDGTEKIIRNLASSETSGKSKHDVIPISTALLEFMNMINTDETQYEISEISLVYKIDSPYEGNAKTDTAFPMWKIISNNKVTYISAYK